MVPSFGNVYVHFRNILLERHFGRICALFWNSGTLLSVKNWFSWLLEDTPVSGQNRLSLPSSNKVGRVSLIVCRIVKTGFIIWKTRKYHCGECKSNLNIWCTFSSMKEMWIMVQARYGSCTHNNKLWLGKKSKLSLHTVELKRVKSVFAASRLF